MSFRGILPLRGFLRASRGKSQKEVIIEFLSALIDAEDIIDNGSVLLNNSAESKLVLFNDGNFLFDKKFLDPNRKTEWRTNFGYYEGIAGRCFRERMTKTYSSEKKTSKEEFVGDTLRGPIKNMVCVPIIISNLHDPFGVVSFHNNDEKRIFTSDEIDIIECYVDTLATALQAAKNKIDFHDQRNVFIVHGRDLAPVRALELLLHREGIAPKVILNEPKSAQEILDYVETTAARCKAGFILITPDDEGRLRGSKDPLAPRARENVIFETGLLFARFRELERVSVLLKKPTKLPSDLAGILYDEFDTIEGIEGKISSKLRQWGLAEKA